MMFSKSIFLATFSITTLEDKLNILGKIENLSNNKPKQSKSCTYWAEPFFYVNYSSGSVRYFYTHRCDNEEEIITSLGCEYYRKSPQLQKELQVESGEGHRTLLKVEKELCR
jgi:hypothetical protein